MGRPYTAWWLRYPGKGERAEKLLTQFKPVIERKIAYWERTCPGEVDWATVFWDAAYRAAWACKGANFWPILDRTMTWAQRKYLATHLRRTSKLTRLEISPLDFDKAVSELPFPR